MYITGNNNTVHRFNNDIHELVVSGAGNTFFDGGSIDVDPQLRDAAGGNFHLSATSPVIDMALDSAPQEPAIDFDGQARIVGTAPDIGADELAFDTSQVPVAGTPGLAFLVLMLIGVAAARQSRAPRAATTADRVW